MGKKMTGFRVLDLTAGCFLFWSCLKITTSCVRLSGKWSLTAGNEDRSECESHFTTMQSHQGHNQPINVLLISVFRWKDDITLSSLWVCTCACGLQQLWVCLQDLLDFPQDSDKPPLCGEQNAFIADSYSDFAENWWARLLSTDTRQTSP